MKLHPLLLLLIFFSCSSQSFKSDLVKENLKGNVRSVSLTEYNIFDGKLISQELYAYNQKGLLVEKKTFLPEGENGQLILVGRKDFTHDEYGNVIQEHEYYIKGDILLNSTYKYDKKGSRIAANKNGSITNYKIKYDKVGNIIEKELYDYNNVLIGKFKYVYDTHGNEIDVTYYNGKSTLEFNYISKYDKDRNLIESKHYSGSSNLIFTVSYKYEYDEMRNWVKRTHLTDNELHEKTSVRKITYAE